MQHSLHAESGVIINMNFVLASSTCRAKNLLVLENLLVLLKFYWSYRKSTGPNENGCEKRHDEKKTDISTLRLSIALHLNPTSKHHLLLQVHMYCRYVQF